MITKHFYGWKLVGACLFGVCLAHCVAYVASGQESDVAEKSLTQQVDPASKPLRSIYAMPYIRFNPIPSIKEGNSAVAVTDFSNCDLRGLHFEADFYEDGITSGISFDNSDLTGFVAPDAEFRKNSFKSAILRDVCFELAGGNDTANATIQGSITSSFRLDIFPGIEMSKNYKEKNLSGAVVQAGHLICESCDLSYSYIIVTPQPRENDIYKNANITGAVIAGSFYSSPAPTRIFPYLVDTKNYKERNLGSVIFMNLDLENTDLSWQTLGYFDSCDLSRVNLEEAYFHAKDERTLTPFSRVIPAGFTGCKISMEQFRTTRNYKIWKESGIPTIEKIRITPENARYYDFEIVDGKVRPKDYARFKFREGIEPTRFGERAVPPKDEVFVYKVGNIHVTEEIANALEKEKREQQKQK